jgi:hypothetical protein
VSDVEALVLTFAMSAAVLLGVGANQLRGAGAVTAVAFGSGFSAGWQGLEGFVVSVLAVSVVNTLLVLLLPVLVKRRKRDLTVTTRARALAGARVDGPPRAAGEKAAGQLSWKTGVLTTVAAPLAAVSVGAALVTGAPLDEPLAFAVGAHAIIPLWVALCCTLPLARSPGRAGVWVLTLGLMGVGMARLVAR